MTAVAPAERLVGRRYAALGMRRMWYGTIIVLAVEFAFDFGQTLQQLGQYRDVAPVLTGWAVLLVADAAVAIVSRVLGEHLPHWLFWLYFIALAAALALDIEATWGMPDMGFSFTVGTSAVLSLVLAAITRSPLELTLAGGGLTAVAAVAMLLGGSMRPATLDHAVFAICHMFLPIVVVAFIADNFRRLVRRETEELLSQSAISAPRLTIGIEASEQLARLDLAAESLLGAVADGRMRLPLSEELAKRAGALATELRLHLLESRSKTWLGLAIDESPLLRQDVRLEDPRAAAGLLSTRQRAALLSALWLLHDERGVSSRAGLSPIVLAFGEPAPAPEAETLDAVVISVDVPGSTRMMVDPGVWEHFAQVGRYRESIDPRGMRIDIRCLVPAVRGGARGRTAH